MEEYEVRRNRNFKHVEAICPACESVVRIRKTPAKGQIVTCKECESLLEVTRAMPLELEWAFEEPIEGSTINSFSQ